MFYIVEYHRPERVMRQFRKIQTMSGPVGRVTKIDRQGRDDTNWVYEYRDEIAMWKLRERRALYGTIGVVTAPGVRAMHYEVQGVTQILYEIPRSHISVTDRIRSRLTRIVNLVICNRANDTVRPSHENRRSRSDVEEDFDEDGERQRSRVNPTFES